MERRRVLLAQTGIGVPQHRFVSAGVRAPNVTGCAMSSLARDQERRTSRQPRFSARTSSFDGDRNSIAPALTDVFYIKRRQRTDRGRLEKKLVVEGSISAVHFPSAHCCSNFATREAKWPQ